ncbi:hypothetical protein [Jannaschia sp. R86511]|uniref:hypothetical protein n=1 Tax=Jannaschia sp. R86511 TaxID=3093853 RepID=UPI0036D40BDD
MNYVILFAQVTVATVVYALIYLWYVAPRLSGLPLTAALQPLLLVQAFRFTGLTLAAEGQVDPAVPRDLLLQAGLGDMATGLLAIVALVLARRGSSATVAVTWLVTVVGLLDFVNVGRIVAQTDLISYDIGGMWLALIWYVPLVLISHLAIIGVLLRRDA